MFAGAQCGTVRNLATFKANKVPTLRAGISKRQVLRAQDQDRAFAKSGGEKTQQEVMYENQIANASDEETKKVAELRLQELREAKELAESTYQTFSFGGVPEDVNGRMCMLAFAWGIVKEFTTGQSIPMQTKTTSIAEWLFFALFIIASVIPSVRNADRKQYQFGPFTETAEVLVGRTAMLGFVGTLLVEIILTRGPVLKAFGLIQ